MLRRKAKGAKTVRSCQPVALLRWLLTNGGFIMKRFFRVLNCSDDVICYLQFFLFRQKKQRKYILQM